MAPTRRSQAKAAEAPRRSQRKGKQPALTTSKKVVSKKRARPAVTRRQRAPKASARVPVDPVPPAAGARRRGGRGATQTPRGGGVTATTNAKSTKRAEGPKRAAASVTRERGGRTTRGRANGAEAEAEAHAAEAAVTAAKATPTVKLEEPQTKMEEAVLVLLPPLEKAGAKEGAEAAVAPAEATPVKPEALPATQPKAVLRPPPLAVEAEEPEAPIHPEPRAGGPADSRFEHVMEIGGRLLRREPVAAWEADMYYDVLKEIPW